LDRKPPPMTPQQADARRPAAVRTALVVAAVALAVYAGAILLGMAHR